MDFSKFNLTPSAKKAIENSQLVAEKFGHLKTIDAHLFLSILYLDHINIDYVLDISGISKEVIVQNFEAVLSEYKEPKRKKQIFAPEIRSILKDASAIASEFASGYIGIDHILVSILGTRQDVIEFFNFFEINIEDFKCKLKNTIKNGIEGEEDPVYVASPSHSEQSSNSFDISSFCENLNEKALEKKDLEIFGREKEINRIFQILLKKNKSNVILVGDAGVGKSAIAEGLAEKIQKRNCPDLLLNKQIISLDLASLVSGTIFRGQLEEKIKNILKKLSEEQKYILFIDEIHTIIGAGGQEGSLDFANIIKPALSRGNISCIGATTSDEYERYFSRDSALNRRFEKIEINEPTKEETLKIITLAKKKYEKFHKVKYKKNVLQEIVDLCDICLVDQKFPDKVFDVLDESGAQTKKLNIVRPEEAKEMEKKLADSEFKSSSDYEDFYKKYKNIMQNWSKSLENKHFSVSMDTVHYIFSQKLDIPQEEVKNRSLKQLNYKKRIGF